MAELNDDILDDGDSIGNYDLDIVDEDALLADDFEESSTSKRTLPDDEDFIEMGVEEDLTDLGTDVGEIDNKRMKFNDANDSEGESEERSRFKTERAFPSKRQTSSIPETLDAIPVKPTANQQMMHRGGGRGRGLRMSLNSRLGPKRGGGPMRPPFHSQQPPHFNRPPFYPNQFNPPNYPNFPPQPPMYYPPYPHQQGPQPPPPMPPPHQQAPPHPRPSQPHGPNIHVNPHFRSNMNPFWNGNSSWNNNSANASSSAPPPPVVSSTSQDYSSGWQEQPPPPGSGTYQQQGSQYYNNGQEYYGPPQQGPYYHQQQAWQGPGPGNPQGNNWDQSFYNSPSMPPAPQPSMVDYQSPSMPPMGGVPPGLMPPGPPSQRHPTSMGPRQMPPPPHMNRPAFRNSQPNFQKRAHAPGNAVGSRVQSPIQPKIKPPVPSPQANKLKSSSSHRSMEVLRTVVITDLPEAKSAPPASSSTTAITSSPATASQPSEPQPPAEEEDDELKEYRRKIEEQKKLREELLRIKEEKRKVAAQQKLQQLEEVPKPVGSQEELVKIRVRTADNRIIVRQLPISRIEKLKQARMNRPNSTTTGNEQLTKNGSGAVTSRVALVDNLSASTSQKQLEELAKTVGPIESVEVIDGDAKKAKVKFQSVESAQAFVNKFQRKMVDLSMINVSLITEQ